MASVTSLGVHKPSALPFLVAEGILPSDPAEDTFTWRTIDEQDYEEEEVAVEEELLITEHCVVWSREGIIQRVFRFDVEGEPVTHAVFTRFQSRAVRSTAPGNPNPTHEDSTVRANGVLNVQKQRASSSKPTATPDFNVAPNDRKGDQIYVSGSENQYVPSTGDRALVVLLKSHAHVFFVSETSYVVHLPFEVDAVFPSIHGLILQRKSTEKVTIPPTPQLPSAPNNSFTLSQGIPSSSPPSSQPLANLASSKISDLPILPLLKNLLESSTGTPERRLPRLFCLTDPLAEIGAVVLTAGSNVNGASKANTQRLNEFGDLNPGENLLYVSPRDELVRGSFKTSRQDPLMLAVTENQENGKLSIWTATYVGHQDKKATQRKPSTGISGNVSRRSSSFAPGMGSGTTTPTVRGASMIRESFGAIRSRRHVSSDPTFDDISTHEPEDLLDSAFGNPTLPAKSSRRVSGLLARADLSTNHDRNTFSDLAGDHTRNKGSRKGHSFGMRLSAGPEYGPNITKSHALHGARTSHDSVSLYEPQLDDLADEFDDIHDLRNLGDPGLHSAVKGLQKEIVLTKIYAMPGGAPKQHAHVDRAAKLSHHVVTMRAPEPSLGDASENATIVMCLIDQEARETLVVQVDAKYSRTSTQPLAAGSEVRSGSWRAQVTAMTRRSGTIDACKVGDGVCNRLLVLEESTNGIGDLSLQAPWTSPFKVELPSSLYLHNPHQITNDTSLRNKREGGFKRILSQGPKALVALQHSGCKGRFDVVDLHGVRHRVHLQLRPHSPIVRQIIKISQSILPSSVGDGETMLRGWWDTMLWLRSRPVIETDTEWTAIIILLFSMAVAFTGEKRTEATPRQKKRKGGLLRSSSGANTDLESWEAMMAQESSMHGILPEWMQSEAWAWTAKEKILPSPLKKPKTSSPLPPSTTNAVPIAKKSPYLLHCISIAREFITSPTGQAANGPHGYLPTASSRDLDVRRTALASILLGLHLLREELKLNNLAANSLHQLTPVLAQIGTWLGWETWGKNGAYLLEDENMETWLFEDSTITGLNIPPEPLVPPSILRFIESTNLDIAPTPILSLMDVASSPESEKRPRNPPTEMLMGLTPRTVALSTLLMNQKEDTSESRVTKMASCGLDLSMLETMPESSAIPFRAAVASCQTQPSTSWDAKVLKMVGRDDIATLVEDEAHHRPRGKSYNTSSNDAIRDVHSICHTVFDVETVGPYDGSAEVDRQSITRLLFKEDQRFAEAAKLVHPLHYPVARCTPEPEWSDTDLLEAQQDLAKVIAARTLSVSVGRGVLFYSARLPLLTEKFPVHGFTLSCIMKPADTTVTADRSHFAEDKVSWAFFHAGAEAGLSISKNAKGIDTSWILFNKPKELTNRHAGFLLALGLNGHLKWIAKWVAFKYLTPKHTMTSIGLLLGLSASYLGTMDTLVTRLLSVHVTRMLPPGAAELNLSPLTQTSGIVGIGLLYCNTQHRRMSEIMLSEMENTDQDDLTNPLDSLRDEGYRLAAGFALGYINLGRGKDLKGLHDMHITERLLTLAVGIRRVNIAHILDKAVPGATVATALIFMKTQDEALARKIDIPDTVHQFDYVRPDIFLLRTVARHLIMWDNIQATSRWINLQLPLAYQHKSGLTTVHTLTSEDMPFFNIIAGLCLSVGLKFAGSSSLDVRHLLCHYLDQFIRICRLPSLSYDGKLARTTVRNCQDVVVLATSCVMAGTGDLHIFRRLRSLHGRSDTETPYGSHLVAHFAIGILFMGGGTHTFGTSNLAVASLLCAFYPLLPTTVLDNKSHLQAFRHFWVLAAERRCLIARDVDTYRPISLPILVTFRSGIESSMRAPCVLPELHTISKVRTNDQEYWTVTLDLAANPSHQAAFARHQSIYVRRRAAYDAHASVFSATMQALNDVQSAGQAHKQALHWIFTLPSFRGFDRAEQALVLPAEAGSAVYRETRGTVVDDRLVVERACLESGRAERLWNLRILFAWAEGVERRGGEWGWFGKEVVEGLKAGLAMRRWRVKDR